MKNYINKSAKRILSLALALVMLAGCLFTANVGVNIKAGAETDGTDTIVVPEGKRIEYWDGTVLTGFWAQEADGTYLITNAAQLYYACMGTRDGTGGKNFVIDSSVYAFIMQPESVIVDKLGGPAAVINLSGAEETRKFFEETYTATGNTPLNWSVNGNQIFNGNIDGNGVGIYGIYCDAVATGAQAASIFQATKDLDATDAMKIANLVIKNSYFKGYQRTSILFGCSWGDTIYSYISVDSCIFANCYLLGQNYKSSAGELYATSVNTGEMGVLGGGVSNDPVQLSNTLVYGNETEYDYYVKNDSDEIVYSTTTKDAFNWVFRSNTFGDKSYYGRIDNCVILDAAVNNLTDQTYCSNVYSNVATSYTTVTKLFDGESTKGSAGMYWASGLNWGNDWFAVEGEYPSPFKPDNYDSNITASTTGYNGGKGTKDDPYIISSADQLYQMVTEQSYSDIKTDSWTLYTDNTGAATTTKTVDNYVSKYYKVADGVDAIYINDVETKAEVEALVEKGGYNYWNPPTTNLGASGAFSGHFDGNGVTIYGMISTSTGFVNKIDGENATIKNVHFKAAHVSTSGKAAVVTTNFGYYGGVSGYEYNGNGNLEQVWKNKNSAYTISNVAVTESYVKTTITSTTGDAATAAGLVIVDTTPSVLKIDYCMFDGGSCTLIDGNDSTANYSASSSKAGIVSTNSSANNWELSNCVSIGAYAVSMQSGGTYSRYKAGAVKLNAVYGVYNDALSKETYPVLANCDNIDGNSFSMLDMPLLNWGGAWELIDYNGRMIPMPKTSHKTVDDYSTQLAKQNNGAGATLPSGNRYGGYTAGQYGMYEAFLGSGTKEDPYIISNALDLARAIACGGKDITTKLYYKLSCDIDVGAASWLNTNTIAGKYEYVPFEGHIDGDGHTIYNLISIGDNASLIPEIVGGASIKNLHIRNSNILSNNSEAGAFFGKYKSDGKGTKVTLEGCSFEGAGVDGGVDYIVGDFSKSIITNSYAIGAKGTRYYQYYETDSADTNMDVPNIENADFYGEEGVTDPVWYKGGKEDCIPQLVNRAKAMSEVDVSGFGDNDYDSNDIVALRQRLLNNPDYANVYGDVSRNGVTNLGDLAILGRQLIGSYNTIPDGFWRNAALGNIVIYYGENDNYDFARKLELALENEFGKDVKKVVVGNVGIDDITYGNKSGKDKLYVHKNDIYNVGTNYYKFNEDADGAITYEQITAPAEIAKYALDGKCQIVVGDIAGTDYNNDSLGVNDYKIKAENTKSAIWLQGGSFTAVEQATLDFINESDPDSSTVYSAEGTLDPNRVAKDVDGTTYYYAWGDEFNSTSLHKDKWNYDVMQNETSAGALYTDLEVAFPDDIEKLYTVNDGRLTIWRGYYGSTGSDIDWGYKYLGPQREGNNKFGGNVETGDIYVTAGKIVTNKSMLVKQGYLEMKAYYPEDGHAFPCWWLVGYSGGTTNFNTDISNTLFGKVFKLNNKAAYNGGDAANAYDGTTNTLNSSNPSTFKYQLPNASYEIDIAEFMQGDANASRNYKTANYTFHKFYGNGIYTNDKGAKAIKFINWDSLLSGGNGYYGISSKATRSGSFLSGYTYNYTTADTDKIYEFYPETVTKLSGNWTSSGKTWNGGMLTSANGAAYFSGTVDKVDIVGGQEYIFGVKWDTTDIDKPLYTFTVHKANADGSKGDHVKTITVKDDIAYTKDTALSANGDNGFLEKLSSLQPDQQIANQYMYMLIDNTYYTADADGDVYNDLLSQNNSNPKIAKMEIDYVRVYQEKRDIVTPDTEEFNNGNHFGY